MKQLLLFLISLIALSAQSYKYFNFSAGHSNVNLQSSAVTLDYTDESPSPDKISVEKTFKDANSAVNLAFTFGGGNHEALHYEFVIDVSLHEDLMNYRFNAGAGYNFPISESSALRTVLGLNVGVKDMQLGTLKNTTGYIQVNDTKFYSKEVDVSLSNVAFGFVPRLEYNYFLSEKYAITVNAGYSFEIESTTPELSFNGEDKQKDGKHISESKKLSAQNVDLQINEKGIDTLPLDFNGLQLSLGFSWYM